MRFTSHTAVVPTRVMFRVDVMVMTSLNKEALRSSGQLFSLERIYLLCISTAFGAFTFRGQSLYNLNTVLFTERIFL